MFKILITFLSVMLLLVSCSECDDIVVCRGITDQAVNKLPFRDQNHLAFTNNEDSMIVFYKNRYHQTASEVKDCYKPFGGHCQCPNCDSPVVSVHFSTEVPIREEYESLVSHSWLDTINGGDSIVRRDTSYTTIKSYYFSNYSAYVRDNKTGDTLSLMIELFDFRNFTTIYLKSNSQYELSLGSGDSLLNSFATPFKTYQNVIKMHSNQSRVTEIEDVFYSIEFGIIAFYSEKLNRNFYLTDL